MNVLVLFAHPLADSYGRAIFDQVMSSLDGDNHDVRSHDLWQENFGPVLSAVEKRNHFAAPETKTANDPLLATHVADLEWCEAIVFVYPSWWSAPPAIMKGWFDRVWVTGVVYEAPAGKNRITSLLHNVQRIVVVTTHGSPKRVNALQGEPGKRTVTRSLRALCNHWCRTDWISIYAVDRATPDDCRRFLERVERRMASLRSRRQAKAPA